MNAGDRAQFVWSNLYTDRDLIIRRSAKERQCDNWKTECPNVIRKGELHAANRYGFAHFCLSCVQPRGDDPQ